MLCDRLNKIYQQALISIKEEEQQPNSVPIAIQLGLKKPPDIRVEEYYPTFLSMAKNFMEGMDGQKFISLSFITNPKLRGIQPSAHSDTSNL